MTIYCFSGLGVDHRIFKSLTLKQDFKVIEWITPLNGEPLQNYVKRLSIQIDNKDGVIFIGVSFGGIVAPEMSKIIRPHKVILISSLSEPEELPKLYRLGKIILPFIPTNFINPPFFISKYLFGITSKSSIDLLEAIMFDTDPVFVKWATIQLVNWQGIDIEINKVCIHGLNDRILRTPKHCDHKLNNAGHFAIVEQAAEISTIINTTLEET